MTIRLHQSRDGIAAGRLPELPSGLEPFEFMGGLFGIAEHICVAVLDPAGLVLWNSWAGKPDADAEYSLQPGTMLTDFVPGLWSEERVECIRRSIETDRPVSLFSIWEGQRRVTRFMPLRSGESLMVLCVCEESSLDEMLLAAENDNEGLVRISRAIELGRLSVLTARELEVLALIGDGLRSKDIANKLSRSVSTVEGHRERIGQKLEIHDRAELLLIARQAGLRLEDADGERVRRG